MRFYKVVIKVSGGLCFFLELLSGWSSFLEFGVLFQVDTVIGQIQFLAVVGQKDMISLIGSLL